MLLILLPSYYICCCLCCKVTTKCWPKLNLVPVIQLEIEIARTRHHQLLRRQSHSPECILSKTLSKLQEQTWGCWDIQQNVSAKMHLVPVIQIEIEIARTRRHQLLRRQSHSPECLLSKTLSNFKNRHEVVERHNFLF